MCDCNDQSGDCQLCMCGRGVSGADAEALTAQLLQNAGAEQAARQGLNLNIDRKVLDSTLAKVVAQRKKEERTVFGGIFMKKSNVTIGSTSSIGEKKSVIKRVSQVFFDESKTQKVDSTQMTKNQKADKTQTARTQKVGISKSSDTQTSNVAKSVSKSNVSRISDTKSVGQIKLENQMRQRKHEEQYKEHVDAEIVETIAKRVEHAEKANKLNTARVRYEKKAKVMEKEEKQTVSHLSKQKKKAEETREFRQQQKKEAKERQIRTIHRTDAFIDHEEQRDEEFEMKKEAEAAEERERLTKAAKYMPASSKTSWTTRVLAFAGTTFLAAGIIGLVFRCLFKESAQTAVDNVITAIVEGTQAMGQSGGDWGFGPGSGGGSGRCVPRSTGKTPKIIDSKRKWPIEKRPVKFAIPGMNNCDEGEEGDFLFDDEDDNYEDETPTDSPTTDSNYKKTKSSTSVLIGGPGSSSCVISGKGSGFGFASGAFSGAHGGQGSYFGGGNIEGGGNIGGGGYIGGGSNIGGGGRFGSSADGRQRGGSRTGSSSDVRKRGGSRTGSSSDVRKRGGSRTGSSSDVRKRGSAQSISSRKRSGLSRSGSASELDRNLTLQQHKKEMITGQQARKLARLNYEETKTLAEQIRHAEERVHYREAKAKAHAVEARLVAIKEWKKDKHKRMEAIRKAEREEMLAVQEALDEARENAKEEKRLQEEEEMRLRREKQAREAVSRGPRRAAGKKAFQKRAKRRDREIKERAQKEEKERQEKLTKAAGKSPALVDDAFTIYGTILVSIALIAYMFRCIKVEGLKAHARLSLQNCLQHLIDTGLVDKAKVALCYAACAACNLFSKIPCPPLPFFYENKSDSEECDDDDEDDWSDNTSDSISSRPPYQCANDVSSESEEIERRPTVTVKPTTNISDINNSPPIASVPITPRRSEPLDYIEPLVIIKSSDTKTEKGNIEKSPAPEEVSK